MKKLKRNKKEMRDKKRIERIIMKLKRIWLKYPDQRLGQLIEDYIIPSGRMRGPNTCRIFHKQDDETEMQMDKILEMIKHESS